MLYVKTLDNQVEIYPYSVQQLINDNPNTSFPSDISNELLSEFNVYPVVPTEPPSYNLVTQNLVELNPALNNGVWVQQWEVVAATPEEIADRKEQLKQQNKQNAKQILSETDWTSIPSVADPAQSNPYLTNQSAFLTYRSEIRDIVLNPTWDAVFPTEPEEIWSNKL